MAQYLAKEDMATTEGGGYVKVGTLLGDPDKRLNKYAVHTTFRSGQCLAVGNTNKQAINRYNLSSSSKALF